VAGVAAAGTPEAVEAESKEVEAAAEEAGTAGGGSRNTGPPFLLKQLQTYGM